MISACDDQYADSTVTIQGGDLRPGFDRWRVTFVSVTSRVRGVACVRFVRVHICLYLGSGFFSNLTAIKCGEKQGEMCARDCAREAEARGRRGAGENECINTETHVRDFLICFHTPALKAFGACCATAHFAVTPPLI